MNQTNIRTFIGVKIPVTTALRELRARLVRGVPNVRLEKAENQHLTLKFLGETADDQVPAITRLLEKVAAEEQPFDLPLYGVGAFPNAKRPSVLWVGVNNKEPLLRLAGALEARLQTLGFQPEARPYHPHFTLTRFAARPPEFVFSLLKQDAKTDFGTVFIRTIELFQSELLPGGPHYTVLASVPLGDA